MKSESSISTLPHLFFARYPFCRLFVFAVALLGSQMIATHSAVAADDEVFILQPEDILNITFPGAPELDAQVQVRRDGALSLPIVGEVRAAGKTPGQLETELAILFEDQLVSNQVRVMVVESHFTYYVEGEVRNPGIIESFRQLSVLEAIIAAGGVDKTTGRMNSVVVLRRKGNKYERHDLNLKAVLEGKDRNAFILESYDVVSIPERVW